MDIPKIKLSDGTSIPQLGFGTWKLRGEACTEAVATALELGYRHIDTAQVYENHTEIAPAIQELPRKELYITSKFPPEEAHSKTLRPAVQRMLEELETPYLDLLLYHWPDRSIPFADTFRALMRIQEEGLIKSIGVSNFTPRHCQDALVTGVDIVTNQVEFHPYLFQEELLDWCRDEEIALTAYSPLARGELASDPALTKIGKPHNKTASQVALRWCIQLGLITIPKATHPDRIRQNMEIFDFSLSDKEMKQIAALHRDYRQTEGDWTDFDYV
jgi:diketogulonate reductase-like aldo/keto reductase